MELGDGDILIDGTWPWLGLHGQGEDRVGPAAHLRSKVFHTLPITNQGIGAKRGKMKSDSNIVFYYLVHCCRSGYSPLARLLQECHRRLNASHLEKIPLYHVLILCSI